MKIVNNGVVFYPIRLQTFYKEEPVNLTMVNYHFLLHFMYNPDVIMSSEDLYERNYGVLSTSNAMTKHVQVNIHKARKTFGPAFILLVPGVGYYMPRAEDYLIDLSITPEDFLQ